MNATRPKRKKCVAALPTMFFILSVFSAALHAQTPQSCPNGFELKFSARQSSQGTLLRVELRSGVAVADVKGTWAGHEVSFWRDDADANVHRAYLGIDLDQAPGPGEFVVTGKLQSGEGVTCSVNVTIKAGQFVVEKLTVDQKYVEPSPEDEARVQKEAARWNAILATRTAEKLWDGNFRFPLAGPRRGSNFGSRRILNGEARSPHSGLDIHAATGTPVHAAQRGRVVLAEELYFAGNTVMLDHGMGIYTFYLHLSKIDVKEGDLVEAGALLGLVGATGRVTGPHLHWGLEVNESRVNPLQILPPLKRARAGR
ncbi:MAG TPA: M23 family metallopeptidase [Candidatus Acidoferrales bacterium]|jgi:murein DD-endopeptidase MepM/ murein hydrolase activator NlpD|nr:M23 family metallopeptidase [Candidatus Acidoferrales bacterium]